jgi:hypothetical protein
MCAPHVHQFGHGAAGHAPGPQGSARHRR